MTTETFFKKFDEFARVPNAVKKMRELILELAISGMLSSDIQGCEEHELGELVELVSGQHLLPSRQNSQGRGIPYITGPADFGGKNPTPTRWTEYPKAIARPGDILLTVKGAGVGKTNVLIEAPTAISRQLMAVRVERAYPEYIHLVLKKSEGRFQSAMTGIAIPGIGRRDVLQLMINLPPLAEQKHIVAKVDELMALCDQLETQEAERKEKGQRLARAALAQFAGKPTYANLGLVFHNSYDVEPGEIRKAILELAVRGKLVEQRFDDKENNLSFFSKASGQKKRSKKQHLPEDEIREIETEGFFAIPHNWVWTTLGIAVDVRDGTHDTPNYTDVGFPLITSKNISSGELSFENIMFISEDDHRQISERSRVDRGDVLFAMIGSIGNPVIVNTDREFSIKNVALFKTNDSEYLEPMYLLVYLKCISDDMKEKAAGAVQSFVSLNFLRSYPFPLPPLAEQKRIVAKVDELMALVDKLEAQQAQARELTERLMEAAVRELTA